MVYGLWVELYDVMMLLLGPSQKQHHHNNDYYILFGGNNNITKSLRISLFSLVNAAALMYHLNFIETMLWPAEWHYQHIH